MVAEQAAGSSPRSRGTPGPVPGRIEQARFIPALAGNTACMSPLMHGLAVHPRARGEHADLSDVSHHGAGSSPRSRGTLRQGQTAQQIGRFIPALAGNTPAKCRPRSRWPVHPRARGEHFGVAFQHGGQHGSSPRSRGTLAQQIVVILAGRFIPALAGNTPRTLACPQIDPVHPRARGEHGSVYQINRAYTGSSPRSRGTHLHGRVRRARARFIPALAGNTLLFLLPSGLRPVHPRARGEHEGRGFGESPLPGSSPRSRGTLFSDALRFGRVRFIPALAGNTLLLDHEPITVPVHPRARGEHTKCKPLSHQGKMDCVGSTEFRLVKDRSRAPARNSPGAGRRSPPAPAGSAPGSESRSPIRCCWPRP